jgi:hypothetical protein
MDHTTITIKHYDIEVSVNLPADTDLEDFINAIEGMIITCGWTQNGFRDTINKLSIYYSNENNK